MDRAEQIARSKGTDYSYMDRLKLIDREEKILNRRLSSSSATIHNINVDDNEEEVSQAQTDGSIANADATVPTILSAVRDMINEGRRHGNGNHRYFSDYDPRERRSFRRNSTSAERGRPFRRENQSFSENDRNNVSLTREIMNYLRRDPSGERPRKRTRSEEEELGRNSSRFARSTSRGSRGPSRPPSAASDRGFRSTSRDDSNHELGRKRSLQEGGRDSRDGSRGSYEAHKSPSRHNESFRRQSPDRPRSNDFRRYEHQGTRGGNLHDTRNMGRQQYSNEQRHFEGENQRFLEMVQGGL